MASTFRESETGQAVIENMTAGGTKQLVVALRPESGFSAEFVFNKA